MDIQELNQFYDALEQADSIRWQLERQLDEVHRLGKAMQWPKRIKYFEGRGIRIDDWDYEINAHGIISDDEHLHSDELIQHVYDASDGEFEGVFEEFFDNIGITVE